MLLVHLHMLGENCKLYQVAKQSNGGDLDKLLSQKVKADKLSLKPRDVAESTLLSPGCRER